MTKTNKRRLRCLGLCIRRRRRELDLTLGQVSARIGVTPATLHRYERGTIEPPWLRLLVLAQVLKLPVQDLVRATKENCK